MNIERAYKELTPPAFSSWVRFHTMADDELINRGKIAERLGRSETSINRILRELRLAGYVDLRTYSDRGDARVTHVILLKRAKIVRRSRFIRLD